MYFHNIPASSRVWIFPSERDLQTAEIDAIDAAMKDFINQWQAHGKDLVADYAILHNRFITVAVNETLEAASGCSIDKLTQLIQDLEKKVGLSLTNRMNIHYKNQNKILSDTITNFKSKLKTGEINGEQILYNTSIANVGDLNNFETKVKNIFT